MALHSECVLKSHSHSIKDRRSTEKNKNEAWRMERAYVYGLCICINWYLCCNLSAFIISLLYLKMFYFILNKLVAIRSFIGK